MIKSKTYIAIPPGATIKEQISDRKMTQKELAARMDIRNGFRIACKILE